MLAGIPTFALVAMRQNRAVHLFGASTWAIFMCCLFRHEINSNFSVWRNVLLCTLYHYIFAGAAYFRWVKFLCLLTSREHSDRQLFMLRAQLKAQYRWVHQLSESSLVGQYKPLKRWSAKRSSQRSVSYLTVRWLAVLAETTVFHEVRVPLNTARLALANLDAEGAFAHAKSDQRDLIIGLDDSHRMMEKV